MRARYFFALAAFTGVLAPLNAQSYQRRASFRPGGNPNQGKCTIEVVVDGAAEVEVRGDTANLRNLSGAPPQWRRFECTGPMPGNPAGFRFQGIDGRGRQELIRDPRDGGAAVVRIEDPESGSEGYTFDLLWSGAYPGNPGGYPNSQYPNNPYPDRGYGRNDSGNRDEGYYRDQRDQDAYHRDREDWYRTGDWRQRFFQRIREDLDHVQSVTFPFGGDQYRLARTKQELDELQGKLARGWYDQRELDEVMGAMQRVVQDNRLSYRDRDILTDDLNRMREFRARHAEWGVR